MKPLFFLFFILIIPIASALYGGETYTKEFEKCYNLSVRIEGNMTIDDEEFILNNECYNISTDNEYVCPCHDDYVFTLTTKVNTINYYTLTFDYNYSDEEEPDDNGGGSSSSGGGSSSKTTLKTEPVNCAIAKFVNTSYCEEWCERYARVNNCYDSKYSKHQCCVTYYPYVADDIQPIEEHQKGNEVEDSYTEKAEPTKEEAPIINDTSLPPIEEEKSSSWVLPTIIITGIVMLGLAALWFFSRYEVNL